MEIKQIFEDFFYRIIKHEEDDLSIEPVFFNKKKSKTEVTINSLSNYAVSTGEINGCFYIEISQGIFSEKTFIKEKNVEFVFFDVKQEEQNLVEFFGVKVDGAVVYSTEIFIKRKIFLKYFETLNF